MDKQAHRQMEELLIDWYDTWVKRYPLVVSSSKGFRIELGTLVLFEANTGAGTGLKNTTTHSHTEKDTCSLKSFFVCLFFSLISST